MSQFRATPLRDAILSELATAPADGYTGTDLWFRLRHGGISCATSGVYKALDGLVDDGFVRRPNQPAAKALAGMLDDLLGALEHGDGFARTVSLAIEGYTLTPAGALAAQVSLARRALAAGKAKQAEGHLLRIQRDLSQRKSSPRRKAS